MNQLQHNKHLVTLCKERTVELFQSSKFDIHIYSMKFLKHITRQNYSQETVTGYTKDLQKFCQFMFAEYEGNILTHEIAKEDIQDYLAFLQGMGFKPNSVARHLSTLKSLYKFLVHEMNFEKNPAGAIKHPKKYKPLPSALSEEELNNLFSVIEKDSSYYETLFKLMYTTGSRITALRTLPKEHIDLKNGKVYFQKVKYGKELYLPLNDTIIEVLERHLFDLRNNISEFLFPSGKYINKPVAAATIRNQLSKYRKLAGIERHITPHMIRHTTATHLTLKKVHQKEIASILGHSDLRSTALYQHLDVDDLRDSVNNSL